MVYIHDKDAADRAVTVTKDGDKNRMDVTTGLSTMPGFNISPFDRIDASYPTTTQEEYRYGLDGVQHTLITVVYETTAKAYITSSVKTDL